MWHSYVSGRLSGARVVGETIFEGIGLTALEADVYALLLEMPAATPADLALRLGTGSADVGATVERLVDRGFASRRPGSPACFTAVSPDAAIIPAVRHQEELLAQTRADAAKLTQTLRQAARYNNPAELIEVLVGAEEQRHRFDQLQRHARHTLEVIDAPPYVTSIGNTVGDQRLAEGICFRTVYSAEGLKLPGRLENDVLPALALGEQARTHPHPPLKLFIADREVALVPIRMTPHNPAATAAAAFVVHTCGLLDALTALFDFIWDTSVPLRQSMQEPVPRASPKSPSPAEDQAAQEHRGGEAARTETVVLNALAAGLTDEAIARALGCSLRTAQRRIRRVMDALSASSRFQAGMIARDRKLV